MIDAFKISKKQYIYCQGYVLCLFALVGLSVGFQSF